MRWERGVAATFFGHLGELSKSAITKTFKKGDQKCTIEFGK